MYRQQAERLAEKLRVQHPELPVEVYRDGITDRTWLVQVYDPRSAEIVVFESEASARAMAHLSDGREIASHHRR